MARLAHPTAVLDLAACVPRDRFGLFDQAILRFRGGAYVATRREAMSLHRHIAVARNVREGKCRAFRHSKEPDGAAQRACQGSSNRLLGPAGRAYAIGVP